MDYAACAEDYLKRCGLSDQEIADLKAKIAPEPVPEPAPEPVSSWDGVLKIVAGWYLGHFSPDAVPAAS